MRGDVMERAKLTQEQADAFEDAKKHHTKDEMLNIHTNDTFIWKGSFEALNELETFELVKALYVGYERLEND